MKSPHHHPNMRLAWVSILAVVTSEEVMEDEGDELEETISNSVFASELEIWIYRSESEWGPWNEGTWKIWSADFGRSDLPNKKWPPHASSSGWVRYFVAPSDLQFWLPVVISDYWVISMGSKTALNLGSWLTLWLLHVQCETLATEVTWFRQKQHTWIP